MELSIKQKWFGIALLAVAVPMGLLATFRLTGIIPEPPTITETVTAETITWKMERPSTLISFAEIKVRNCYSDELASVDLEVSMANYRENSAQFGDCLCFSVSATATVQQGFVYSVHIIFSRTDENAFLLVSEQMEWMTLENLKIASLSTEATYSREAHLYATGVNNPKTCTLENPVFWYFLDVNENNLDHWTNVTLETTYFNGTAYRKVVTPTQIGIMRDAGNSIGDPNVREIEQGTYKAFVGQGIPHGSDDLDDYYEIFIEKECVLNVTMKPANNSDFNLYLYDPIKEMVACSENESDDLESIQHTTNSAGYWYIQVKTVDGYGIYTLEIEISEL